jgi:hypothetical protein
VIARACRASSSKGWLRLGEPRTLVEHFFRHELGRSSAVLTRSLGVRRLDLFEDVVEAALVPVTCVSGHCLLRLGDVSLWTKRGLGVAAAVLTPRVRLRTVCDRARESNTEAGVYHLRGVRQRIVPQVFPFVTSRLWLFFVLSSHRSGTYPGYIRVLNDRTDKAIFFAHLGPSPLLAAAARLRCSFSQAGRYTVQVWFTKSREGMSSKAKCRSLWQRKVTKS